jgi:hypothetical protein
MLALLAHRAGVAHTGGGDEQRGLGVAHPERLKPAQFLGQLEA